MLFAFINPSFHTSLRGHENYYFVRDYTDTLPHVRILLHRDGASPIISFTVSRIVFGHAVRHGWKRSVACHMFRHSLGTHIYEAGYDLLTIQKLLSHKSASFSLIYVSLGVRSPFDFGSGAWAMRFSRSFIGGYWNPSMLLTEILPYIMGSIPNSQPDRHFLMTIWCPASRLPFP